MDEQTPSVLCADNYSIGDFGIIERGTFDVNGMPSGWLMAISQLCEALPRWLMREPVMEIAKGEVYLRGMHSPQLSKERRAKMRGYGA